MISCKAMFQVHGYYVSLLKSMASSTIVEGRVTEREDYVTVRATHETLVYISSSSCGYNTRPNNISSIHQPLATIALHSFLSHEPACFLLIGAGHDCPWSVIPQVLVIEVSRLYSADAALSEATGHGILLMWLMPPVIHMISSVHICIKKGRVCTVALNRNWYGTAV